jgi:hypothetical protein
MKKRSIDFQVIIASLMTATLTTLVEPVNAANLSSLTDLTDLTNPWLFIGTGAPNDSTTEEGRFNKGIGEAVQLSNFEIGADKAWVPANEFESRSPEPPFGSYGPGLAFDDSSSGNLPLVPFFNNQTLKTPANNIPASNPINGIFGPQDLPQALEGPSSTVDGMIDFGGPIVGVLPCQHCITFDGQVAVTHTGTGNENGQFNFSNIGVFAKNQSDLTLAEIDQGAVGVADDLPAGVVCAGAANDDKGNGGCVGGASNTAFNDERYPNSVFNRIPNSFDSNFQLKEGNGLTGNFDFSALRDALDKAVGVPVEDNSNPFGVRFEDGFIRGLTGETPVACIVRSNNNVSTDREICRDNGDGTATLDLSPEVIDLGFNDIGKGTISAGDGSDPSTLFVKLRSGLNIIDIDTGTDSNGVPNPFNLINSNIIVDGPEDAQVIFRLPFGGIFDCENCNILHGGMGIMNMNILFFADTQFGFEEDASTITVFDFDNFLVNGAAFWSLGDATQITVNNSQGCVQYIGDKLNVGQDVRYNRCSFKGEAGEPEVPEPRGIVSLLAIGFLLIPKWKKG